MSGKRIAIALGGNALVQPGQKGTFKEQKDNSDVTAEQLSKLVSAGYKLLLTHGNGPQVGAVLLQQQAGEKNGVAPSMPLAACGAMTQGNIGYMFAQSMRNTLTAAGHPANVVCTVTQTIVDPEDEAFQHPTKPIGGFMTKEEAERKAADEGCTIKEDAGRGYRVVVASPWPQEIVEGDAIRSLVDNGFVVVCSGGGGIPVKRAEDGTLSGVDAVIDKDRSASILAHQMECDHLVILTDVEQACIRYRQPDEEKLGRVTLRRMKELMAEGHFAAGSMLPKVQAICKFVESTGKPGIITSLYKAYDAVHNGGVGTVVVPDEE